ncbi:MAG TPA: D-2-hydroxyacid dehydrogenase [Vicinamibacteria bacterium]|nr:D-2-hydroxyacid dehydrogenase [Vicinamibacteria bacterium]
MSPGELNVLVLAPPDDTSVRRLAALPPGVRTVLGQTPPEFGEAAATAEVILHCSGGRPRLEPLLARAPRVRWVHSCSAGVEGLLFPALVDGPVVLTNARGAYSRSLAEWSLAAVLFFAKDLRRLLRSQAEGRWDPFDPEEVAGRTLGIVGYGDIGRAVARYARALGLRVVALRRRPERDPLADEVVGPGGLLDLMRRSDYVVVAAPITAQTRGLVSRQAIEAMKPSAVLVNVGRGPVVDEAALLDALTARRIRGAALDVFEQEPLPAGHPFYGLDNVLLSPHSADHVAGWREAAVDLFVEQVGRFRRGEPLANVVDKAHGY